MPQKLLSPELCDMDSVKPLVISGFSQSMADAVHSEFPLHSSLKSCNICCLAFKHFKSSNGMERGSLDFLTSDDIKNDPTL